MDNQTIIFVCMLIAFIVTIAALYISLSSYYSALRTLNILKKIDQQALLNNTNKKTSDKPDKPAEPTLLSEELKQVAANTQKDVGKLAAKEVLPDVTNELKVPAQTSKKQDQLDLELSGFSEIPHDNLVASAKDRSLPELDFSLTGSPSQANSVDENKINIDLEQLINTPSTQALTTTVLPALTTTLVAEKPSNAADTASSQERAKAIFDQIKMSANQPAKANVNDKNNKISAELLNASFEKNPPTAKSTTSTTTTKTTTTTTTTRTTTTTTSIPPAKKQSKTEPSKSKSADLNLNLPDFNDGQNIVDSTIASENKKIAIPKVSNKSIKIDLELSAFSEMTDDPMVANERDRAKPPGDANQLLNLVASIKNKKNKPLSPTVSSEATIAPGVK